MSAETEALQARLEAARQRKAEIEAAARISDEEQELAEQVERVERETLEAEALERAKQEHGPLGKKIGYVDTREGRVILKRPNPVLYKKFQDTNPEELNVNAVERLVRSCLVYPDVAAFERLIEAQPHAIIVCGKLIGRLAGTDAKEVAGK